MRVQCASHSQVPQAGCGVPSGAELAACPLSLLLQAHPDGRPGFEVTRLASEMAAVQVMAALLPGLPNLVCQSEAEAPAEQGCTH